MGVLSSYRPAAVVSSLEKHCANIEMKEFLRITLVALLVLSVAALKLNTVRKLFHQEPQFKTQATRSLPLKYVDQQVDNFNPQSYGTFEMVSITTSRCYP